MIDKSQNTNKPNSVRSRADLRRLYAAQANSHLVETENFKIVRSKHNPRILDLKLSPKAIRKFFDSIISESNTDLHAPVAFISFERFALADKFIEVFGSKIDTRLLKVLRDWNAGALIIDASEANPSSEEIYLLSTAVAHCLNAPRCDDKGSHVIHFKMSDRQKDEHPLVNPYNPTPLHTDGNYYAGRTDWLLFAKAIEENVKGGESNLLHINDWKDYAKFREHPLAKHNFVFQGPGHGDSRRATVGNRNDIEEVRQAVFFTRDGNPSFRFTYQYVKPRNRTEARFLRLIAKSLRSHEAISKISLPPGKMYLINNNTWLHGRAPFEPNPKLKREAFRLIGEFPE